MGRVAQLALEHDRDHPTPGQARGHLPEAVGDLAQAVETWPSPPTRPRLRPQVSDSACTCPRMLLQTAPQSAVSASADSDRPAGRCRRPASSRVLEAGSTWSTPPLACSTPPLDLVDPALGLVDPALELVEAPARLGRLRRSCRGSWSMPSTRVRGGPCHCRSRPRASRCPRAAASPVSGSARRRRRAGLRPASTWSRPSATCSQTVEQGRRVSPTPVQTTVHLTGSVVDLSGAACLSCLRASAPARWSPSVDASVAAVGQLGRAVPSRRPLPERSLDAAVLELACACGQARASRAAPARPSPRRASWHHRAAGSAPRAACPRRHAASGRSSSISVAPAVRVAPVSAPPL